MKRFLLFAIAITTICSVKAQDVIVMKDAIEVQAKVTAITDKSVSYKRWSYLEGPTYTTSKANVFYIKYANGEKDIIQSMTTTQQSDLFSKLKDLTPIKFQGYGYIGTIFNAYEVGPSVDLSFGVKIYEYFYTGIQTGFHSVFTENLYCAYIPIGLNMKGYLTRGRKVNPYINCSLGGFIGLVDMEDVCGFHCQIGAGIDVKRFTFGIGYNGLVMGEIERYGFGFGYVQLGIRFGKN